MRAAARSGAESDDARSAPAGSRSFCRTSVTASAPTASAPEAIKLIPPCANAIRLPSGEYSGASIRSPATCAPATPAAAPAAPTAPPSSFTTRLDPSACASISRFPATYASFDPSGATSNDVTGASSCVTVRRVTPSFATRTICPLGASSKYTGAGRLIGVCASAGRTAPTPATSPITTASTMATIPSRTLPNSAHSNGAQASSPAPSPDLAPAFAHTLNGAVFIMVSPWRCICIA